MRARPPAPEVAPSTPTRDERFRPDPASGFTPAELRALERSAPLTPAQFRDLRRLADQGVNPLRRH